MNVDKIIDEIVSSKQIWYSTSRFGGKILDVQSDVPILDVKLKVVKPIAEGNIAMAGVDWLSIINTDVEVIQNLLNDGYIILYTSNSTDRLLWCHSYGGVIFRGTVLLGNKEKSSFTLDKFWLATEEFTRDYAYVISIRPSLLLAPALVCAIEMIDNKTFTLREVRESTLQLPQTSLPRHYVKYIASVMFGIICLSKDNKVEHVFDTDNRDFYTLSALIDSIKLALLSNNCEYIWNKLINAECKDSIHEYISKFVPSNN